MNQKHDHDLEPQSHPIHTMASIYMLQGEAEFAAKRGKAEDGHVAPTTTTATTEDAANKATAVDVDVRM